MRGPDGEEIECDPDDHDDPFRCRIGQPHARHPQEACQEDSYRQDHEQPPGQGDDLGGQRLCHGGHIHRKDDIDPGKGHGGKIER